MRRLGLTEYERAVFPNISVDTARALNRTGLVRVTRAWAENGSTLQASSVVGVVRAGSGNDAVEIHITPKLGISRLIWLLGHARDQTGWREDDVELGSELGLLPAMAVMFAARARRALVRGVLRGYREYEETLPMLRGRVREADQIRARPGMPMPLEVRFDDYTADVAENQLLRTAAVRLLSLPDVPVGTRVQLTQIDRALADASLLTIGATLPKPRMTRLNQRYGPALKLAELVLQRTSIEQRGTPESGYGFAFDMNHVYEDWLTAALKGALETRGGSVQRQQGLYFDDEAKVGMQTDITWADGDTCLAVIDAKYKYLRPTGPRPEDLYQLLAYCTTLGLPSGHLVYPAGGPGRITTVRNVGIRIYAHVVPLRLPVEELLSRIEALAEYIADGATARQTS